MATWMTDFVERLEGAKGEGEIEAALCLLSERVGLETYSLSAHGAGESGAFLFEVHNWPEGLCTRYNEDYWQADPNFHDTLRSPLPLGWGLTEMRTRVDVAGDRRALACYEDMRDHRLMGGVVLCERAPRGVTSMLGMTLGDRWDFAESRHCLEAKVQLRAMMPWLHQALCRAAEGALFGEGARELTARERECLQWAAAGKSAWEVGVILGIAERTVVDHLTKAKEKLGAATRTHAVAKAVMLGLIEVA